MHVPPQKINYAQSVYLRTESVFKCTKGFLQ
jgi:hypothetical protein